MRLNKMQICNGIKKEERSNLFWDISYMYFFEFIVESSERILKKNIEMQKQQQHIEVFQDCMPKDILIGPKIDHHSNASLDSTIHKSQ